MSHSWTRIAIGVCGFITAGVLVFFAARPALRLDGAEAPAASPAAKIALPDLVAQVSHAIVRVDIWRQFQVKDAKTGKVATNYDGMTGTGFVIRSQWVGGNDTTDDIVFDVVTDNHVLVLDTQRDWIAPAKLLCVAYGMQVTGVTLVGADATADLAVVRVTAQAPKGKGPSVLSWADPSSVRVGDEVVAIGYARDLSGRPSVSRGIVSATRRGSPTTGIAQELTADLIQSDAAVNHGNSGGPLLNSRGEVVGVNSCIIPPTVTKDANGNISVDPSPGISFARSSRTARPFVEQIESSGKVARLNPGCAIVTLVEPYVHLLGWPQGVLVATVAAGAPAAKAGIQPGDVIIGLGSAANRPAAPDPSMELKINSFGDLEDALGLRSGDSCMWIRYARPSAATAAAIIAGQQPPFAGGVTNVAYLR